MAPLIAALFYPIGFIAVIIGRAQLFTENTLYPVTIVLDKPRFLAPMLPEAWADRPKHTAKGRANHATVVSVERLVAIRKALVGLLIVALTALALAAPASAFQPKAGSWFSGEVDPSDESNGSSIQFKVAKNRKKLTKVTIYWRCGDLSGYHSFRNPPIPIGINKKKRFKLVGATTPPAGQSTRDFTLKGRFISARKASYSMKLQGCGPKTTGRLTYAGS